MFKIKKMSYFTITLFLLGGCMANTTVLTTNTTIMNIWLSPDYTPDNSDYRSNYLAVVVTGAEEPLEISAAKN